MWFVYSVFNAFFFARFFLRRLFFVRLFLSVLFLKCLFVSGLVLIIMVHFFWEYNVFLVACFFFGCSMLSCFHWAAVSHRTVGCNVRRFT